MNHFLILVTQLNIFMAEFMTCLQPIRRTEVLTKMKTKSGLFKILFFFILIYIFKI